MKNSPPSETTNSLILQNSTSEKIDNLPLEYFLSRPSNDLIILCYHLVTDEVPIHLKHLYHPRSKKDFKNDLTFFLKYYKPISASDLIASIKNDKKLPKKSFLLSFDDGMVQEEETMNFLKETEIPAIFFLNSNFIDNQHLFYRFKASILIEQFHQLEERQQLIVLEEMSNFYEHRINDFKNYLLGISYKGRAKLEFIASLLNVNFQDYLTSEKPFYSTAQIRQLLAMGFEIGAHSIDHPRFSEISLQEQIAQIETSLAFLYQKFDVQIKTFAFPFSDLSIKKELFGYLNQQSICDLTFGTGGMRVSLEKGNFQRISMERQRTAEENILLEYRNSLIRKENGQNTIVRE